MCECASVLLGKCSDCAISELLPASTYLLGAVKFISILCSLERGAIESNLSRNTEIKPIALG